MLLEHEIGLNAYLLLFKKNVSSETNFSSDYLSDRDIPWIIYRAVVFFKQPANKMWNCYRKYVKLQNIFE